MTIEETRNKLHDLIDTMDEHRLLILYALLEEDMSRRELIFSERESYLKGEGKSYTPAEVRSMAMNKEDRIS